MLNKEDLQAISELMDQKLEPLKLDITDIKQDITEIKHDVTGTKLHIENVTDKNIELIAENHCNLVEQLNQAIPKVSKELLYEVKVNYLEAEVKELKKAVKELQNRTA